MKCSPMTKLAGFIAAFALASVAFAGLPPAARQNNSDSASMMLSEIHDEAYGVRDSADLLRAYNLYLTGWEMDADHLEIMRDQINQMDQALQRLRTMEGVLPKDQDAEINKVAPALLELTNTAQAAISCFNDNKLHLWVPQYRTYLGEMYNEANRIEQCTGKSASNFRGAESGVQSGYRQTSNNGS